MQVPGVPSYGGKRCGICVAVLSRHLWCGRTGDARAAVANERGSASGQYENSINDWRAMLTRYGRITDAAAPLAAARRLTAAFFSPIRRAAACDARPWQTTPFVLAVAWPTRRCWRQLALSAGCDASTAGSGARRRRALAERREEEEERRGWAANMASK